MNYVEDTIGISRAGKTAGLPISISFTVETDGRLPSSQTLKDAIQQVDLATNRAPIYYMINCAHPTHFEGVLASDKPWTERLQGIRANASTKSHAELDDAEELDAGNPDELGSQYLLLKNKLTKLNVLGGCCGTDHRHVQAICKTWLSSI